MRPKFRSCHIIKQHILIPYRTSLLVSAMLAVSTYILVDSAVLLV